MRKLLAIALLFCSTISYAGEGFMAFGVGVFSTAKRGYGSVKTFSLGHRIDLMEGIYWQNRLGAWGQGSNPDGMRSGGFGSSGPGLRVDLAPVELYAGYGVAVITTPDSYLGGRFPQFQGEIGVTLRDRGGNGIGLEYQHISSAGLNMPNMGRDFLVFKLSQRW